MRGWLRSQCGTRDEFWASEAWEVAAALGVGVYAPPDTPDADTTAVHTRRGPVRRAARQVGSRRAGAPPHPRKQADLLRQRIAHANDPDNVPAPQIIGPGVAGLNMQARSLDQL